jgi:hypothetical protein
VILALSTRFTELLGAVWASEAIDLITDLPSAADLVATLAARAEDALARAGRP